MRQLLRAAAKAAVHTVGLDLVRFPSLAEDTLLGLKSLPIRTVLDVGANLGRFAREALRTFPGATLYCFEPHAGVFAQLRQWATTVGAERVMCFQAALGDMDGEIEMKSHSAHPSSSSLLETTEACHRIFPQTVAQTPMQIQMAQLDRFLLSHSISLADDVLIKVDVQGFEDRVLRGGQATFARARACILEISFLPLYVQQAGFHQLYLALHQLGLRYAGNLHQILADDGRIIYVDAVFVRE